MSTEYKIETVGGQFIVVDPWGEIVDRYPSEEEARQNIERCKREVAISDKGAPLGGERHQSTHAVKWGGPGHGGACDSGYNGWRVTTVVTMILGAE